jgi:hypothetical protein
LVKRPLVVLYLVYIYIKILTSLVNITLSQSVRAVWHGVHPTLSVSGPVEYIPGFRCTVILSLSGGLAVRAWDQSVPSSPSVGPLISFCPLVVWFFFLGEGVNHSG